MPSWVKSQDSPINPERQFLRPEAMPMRQPAIPRTNSACRISRLGALKLSASLRSMSSGDLRRRSNIAESEVRLQIFQRLSVRLRVGIDEVVERIALLIGRETDGQPLKNL